MLIDGDSSHTAQNSEELASAIGISFESLPIRSPELNPVEGLWRDGKRTICANRQYQTIDEVVARFVEYLELQSNHTALTKAGLLSERFWLHSLVSKNFLPPT